MLLNNDVIGKLGSQRKKENLTQRKHAQEVATYFDPVG